MTATTVVGIPLGPWHAGEKVNLAVVPKFGRRLSSLGVDKIKSSPDMIRQRNGVRDFTPEKVLWAP